MEDRIKELRANLTQLINNVKGHSDRLTDWEKLPILEVNVFLAKVNKLYEKTVVLKAVLEEQNSGRVTFDADVMHDDLDSAAPKEKATPVVEEKQAEPVTSNTCIEEPAPAPAPEAPSKTLAPEEEASLADKLRKRPISRLMEAIGLNEKYLYSNELFEGDMARFLEFVESIDKQPDITQALHVFSEYKNKAGWDEENETTTELLYLIERRFL